MVEVWKDIIGYEGLYQVSNFGEVKSMPRYHFNQFGAKIKYKEKILKPVHQKKDDTYTVCLYKNKNGKLYTISRLVGLHFLESPENDKMVVAHITPDRTNNRVDNLCWNIINRCRATKTNKFREILKNNNPVSIDIESISGIYKIINITNDKFYIGSAKNLLKRLMQHFSHLRHNESNCTKLQRAYNKYGEGNFKIVLLEECEISKLIEREQYYIDTLKPYYNILLTVNRQKNN